MFEPTARRITVILFNVSMLKSYRSTGNANIAKEIILEDLVILLCLANVGSLSITSFLTITILLVVPSLNGGTHRHVLAKASRRRQRGAMGRTLGHRGLVPLAVLTPHQGPAATMFFVTNPSTATCLYRAATRLYRPRPPW